MIALLQYLFYRIFKFVNLTSFGLKANHNRASAITTFPILLYFLSLLEILGVGANGNTIIVYLAAYLPLYIYFGRLYSNESTKKKIFANYEPESLFSLFFGGFMVLLYLVAPIIISLKLRLS